MGWLFGRKAAPTGASNAKTPVSLAQELEASYAFFCLKVQREAMRSELQQLESSFQAHIQQLSELDEENSAYQCLYQTVSEEGNQMDLSRNLLSQVDERLQIKEHELEMVRTSNRLEVIHNVQVNTEAMQQTAINIGEMTQAIADANQGARDTLSQASDALANRRSGYAPIKNSRVEAALRNTRNQNALRVQAEINAAEDAEAARTAEEQPPTAETAHA